MSAFIQVTALLILATFVFDVGKGHADVIKNYPKAVIQIQNDSTLVIQELNNGVSHNAPIRVSLFGVTSNPARSGMVDRWYGRAFPNRVVHVRLVWITDPKTGHAGSLGATVSVNGIDLASALVKEGFLMPSGVCREYSNKAYCNRLMGLSRQSQSQPRDSSTVQQYSPRPQTPKGYNPNNPWINPNRGVVQQQTSVYQLPQSKEFWDQTRSNVQQQMGY